jgi:hypothetical protein
MCEKGTLKPTKEKFVMFGIDLGTYPAEKCTFCGEIFNDAAVMDQIEATAKRKGIWGIGKKTKITRSGNSLAVRIPKDIANFLHLKEGQAVAIHPDDKKLVIEPT